MPLTFTDPPSELDAVYVRAQQRFNEDPAAFQHDEPLLFRAFNALLTSAETREATAILSRRIREIEGELQQVRTQAASEQAQATERQRLLRRDLMDSEHRAVVLAERVGELEAELAQTLARIPAPAERDRLAELGWKKG